MAWHADLEWVKREDLENASSDKLQVVRRGHLEEGAAKSIRGSGRIRQQRAWSRTGSALAIPAHKSDSDVGAALALAELRGPLEAVLLLVCCEDFDQWPKIVRYGLPVLNHPHGLEALTDAMHRIMWRRPVMPLEARAKALKLRKADYAAIRAAAEQLALEWLALAAQRFITALKE